MLCIVSILNFETHCSSLAAVQRVTHQWVCTVFFLKIRSVWIMDTIVCSLNCFGCSHLPGPAWDSIQFSLKIGFICPFVVIGLGPFDPANLGATIVFAQALCLTVFHLWQTHSSFLPQAHNACLFTNGYNVCGWVEDEDVLDRAAHPPGFHLRKVRPENLNFRIRYWGMNRSSWSGTQKMMIFSSRLQK